VTVDFRIDDRYRFLEQDFDMSIGRPGTASCDERGASRQRPSEELTPRYHEFPPWKSHGLQPAGFR
jgi:hypothetical protein